MASSAIWSVPIAWGISSLPFVARAILISVKGKLDNSNPRDRDAQVASLPKEYQGLAVRLASSHTNQLETLGYYAAGVAVAVAVRVPPETLAKLTGFYIKSRIAFTLAYAMPQVAKGALRSLTFVGSMTSIGLLYAAAAETAIASY
eukprot:GFKZ01001875.1.p1 GENE.GFKZ01001875.1~~GFKZ01001875.1.p1  ORF type:complete len:146 (-),score=12.59 GFKZ01001875.1:1081-1518(-)